VLWHELSRHNQQQNGEHADRNHEERSRQQGSPAGSAVAQSESETDRHDNVCDQELHRASGPRRGAHTLPVLGAGGPSVRLKS
jgi:hypothetical protein